MNNKLLIATIVPIASLLLVASFAIPFGFLLYQVHHHTSLGAIGVIIIGMILLIGTPAAAFILDRSSKN